MDYSSLVLLMIARYHSQNRLVYSIKNRSLNLNLESNSGCKAADDFALQFKKTGALQVAGPLHIEEAPNIEDKKRIAALAESLFKSSLNNF